jgi:hypothetical protein
MKVSDLYTLIIRVTLVACISISIGMMYYVNVVQKDFIIFMNPDGSLPTPE